MFTNSESELDFKISTITFFKTRMDLNSSMVRFRPQFTDSARFKSILQGKDFSRKKTDRVDLRELSDHVLI